MIMPIQELLRKAIGPEGGCISMGQLAQMHNNIHFFQKSLSHFEKYIGSVGKADVSQYQFSALSTFTQLRYFLYKIISKLKK